MVHAKMDHLDLHRLQNGLVSRDFKTVEPFLHEFDKYLTVRTFIKGYDLGHEDEIAWAILHANKVTLGLIRKSVFLNISRWFNYVETNFPEVQQRAKVSKPIPAAADQPGGQYNIKLQDTANGVITRFPPEPSGYLHIGHAKAALLNDYFAHSAFSGSLILRFDDTNPKKESQEFEDSILHDLELLGIKPQRVTYTSDYFEQLYELCQRLILDGNAYAEDTDPKIQKIDRRDRLASKCRDRPPSESLAIFQEMREGTELGKQHCIRARIAFDSSNGSLRDPVIYRFPRWEPDETSQPHHRVGWTWQIFPTYDFACPLVDSIEGVTHALRTTEYADRNEQYDWFLKTLGMRHVYLWDFARINFIRTFLSKRKLATVVASGQVTGWDDPRMPTVRGILRRGLTVDALREFMLKQGPSRNLVSMDWTILWAMNKKIIDPIAPRHTAVELQNAVPVTIVNGPETPQKESRPKHPKNAALGTKILLLTSRIYIDQMDAMLFREDEEITLMSWGNAFVRSIVKSDNGSVSELQCELHLDGNVSKTDKKVHWLAAHENDLPQAELWTFDYLLTKDSLEKTDKLQDYLNPVTSTTTDAMLDWNCIELSKGSIIQLERKGYYRMDKAVGQGPNGKAVLFKIPTGGLKG